MKKILSALLALTFVLALAACTPKVPDQTDPSTVPPTQPIEPTQPSEPTQPTDPVQTKWSIFDDYYTGDDQTQSVWGYYFVDPSDNSVNEMGGYEVRDNIRGWYPWEGSWVGAGFNSDAPGYIEINVEAKDAMRAVIGFKAPADGKYVICGQVADLWGQNPEKFFITKGDDEIFSLDLSGAPQTVFHLNAIEVELTAGEEILFQATSLSDWFSCYVNLTVEKDGAVNEYTAPVEGAIADFSTETADGKWLYACSVNGGEFTVNSTFDTPDWDGDGEADASQWYSEGGTGIGINFDVPNMLEANVNPGAGETCALGYKAEAAGAYTFTVYAQDKWSQGGSLVIHRDGADDMVYALKDVVTETTIRLELAEGEVVYFHGAASGSWLSTYLNVVVHS